MLKTILQCDMDYDCRANVTHIEEKGYVYCSEHAKDRKDYGHRVRKLTKAETAQLLRNEPLKSYDRQVAR